LIDGTSSTVVRRKKKKRQTGRGRFVAPYGACIRKHGCVRRVVCACVAPSSRAADPSTKKKKKASRMIGKKSRTRNTRPRAHNSSHHHHHHEISRPPPPIQLARERWVDPGFCRARAGLVSPDNQTWRTALLNSVTGGEGGLSVSASPFAFPSFRPSLRPSCPRPRLQRAWDGETTKTASTFVWSARGRVTARCNSVCTEYHSVEAGCCCFAACLLCCRHCTDTQPTRLTTTTTTEGRRRRRVHQEGGG
jgi:hypothetical protein